MLTIILLAGGTGTRMNSVIPKQFMLLAGKPVVLHILERLEKMPSVDEIVFVCHQDYFQTFEEYKKIYNLKKKYILVAGGPSRQASVLNGLNVAGGDSVIIHESARPFVTIDEFEKLITSTASNVIYATRIPFTVASGSEFFEGILDREKLFNVQLPQKFTKAPLLAAHRQALADHKSFTDDSSLLFYYTKAKIAIYEGTEYNIKLTNRIDVLFGEVIYKNYIMGREIE